MLIPLLFLTASSVGGAGFPAGARQPQLAAAQGVVGMAFGAGTSVYYTSSGDGGTTWSAAAKVSETTTLALGRHRGPRVAVLKNAVVISAVVGGEGTKQADTLVAFQSTDGGKSWRRGGVINDVPLSAREGLHAMTAAPNGTLYTVWLDLRSKGTKLYGAKSTDAGLTWSKNYLVYASPDGTICQCCHPTLAVDAAGNVQVMWRNVIDGSRDFYMVSSSDAYKAARKLGSGTWKLDACPMDGGGLVMEGGKAYSAWRRESDIYYAVDATERRVAPGKDVALVLNTKHEPFLAWTHEGGISALTPESAKPVKVAKEGGFVSLVALPDGGVLAAWEMSSGIEFKRLDR